MDECFARTAMLLGEPAMEALSAAHVAVFGLGGVGSYAVEALARSGVGALTLVDADTVCASNINRQLFATHDTLGQFKADVAAARVRAINPHARVDARICFYGPDTADAFDLARVDYVIDAIDTVSSKLLLIARAASCGTRILSCMGTGNKLDASRLRFADIYETSVCPLARVMRAELRKRNIAHLRVLYSTEEPIRPAPAQREAHGEAALRKRQTPGSVAFVPSVAGLMLAGEVVRALTGGAHLIRKGERS